MKAINVILIIIGVLIVAGIIYLVIKSNKQAKIKNAATSAGIPSSVAQVIAESSDPAAAARSIGVPDGIADAIASGTTISSNFTNPSLSGKLVKTQSNARLGQCPPGTLVIGPVGKDENGINLYDCYTEVAETK